MAPLATLVDRLGPASPPEKPEQKTARLATLIFTVIALALLLEWASRRLRGVA